MKKLVSLILALVLCLSLAPAFAEGAPVEVIDALGRAVTIDTVPETIVSMSAANTEILFALGLGDKVIGVDVNSNYPEEAQALPCVGDYYGPNIELILSMEPDIVFADDTIQGDTITALEALGIQVVAVSGVTYADVRSGISLIAECTGADPTAVFAEMDAAEAQALALVPESGEKPLVYYALSYGDWGDWTCGKGTFMDDMLTMLGCENLGGTQGYGWLSMSQETLLMSDPDVIILATPNTVEDITAQEVYSAMTAVQSGRVYVLDADMCQRPAPRIAQALLALAQVLYQ